MQLSAPAFVGSDIYRQAAYGQNHPLSIARVEKVTDLCRTLNWLPDDCFIESPVATREQLEWFHDPAYLDAFRDASATGRVDQALRQRFGFGTMENPLFPGVYQRASTTVGGSIQASRLALQGRVVFHPAGGTHHAHVDRARGFCYMNDPVFSVLTLLRAGLTKVLYIDLDAHHGDGVQVAFANDARVRTVSVHEIDRWPNSGAANDNGKGYALNLPVPRHCNDSEFMALLDNVLEPVALGLEPEAIVMTCGADACIGDPLSQMQLSNQVQWAVVRRLSELSDKVVILGGGGYNPWTLIRYWTGLWGTLSGQTIPATLDQAQQCVFDGLDCDLVDEEDRDPLWLSRLSDRPNDGPVRAELLSMMHTAQQSMIPEHWPVCQPMLAASATQ